MSDYFDLAVIGLTQIFVTRVGNFLRVYLAFGQTFELILARFIHIGQIFIVVIGPNIKRTMRPSCYVGSKVLQLFVLKN